MMKSKIMKIASLIVVFICIALIFILTKIFMNSPKFINHKRSTTKVNIYSFENDSCDIEKFEKWGCAPDKSLFDLGCDDIFKPDDHISQLFELYPVVKCHVMLKDDNDSKTEGLYRVGGMIPIYARFAVLKPNGWRILKTANEIRDELPPIMTKNHALGYAAAITGYSAYFDQSYKWGAEYVVDSIEDSYVKETQNGFQVVLFDEEIFGCGPHWIYSVDLEINKSGEIREISRRKLYHKLSEDNLCVD